MKLKFWQKSLRFIANRIYPCKIYGKENLTEGSAVIVSNHFSMIDCVHYLNLKVGKDTPYFLAKKELFKKKFVNKLLSGYGGLPIDRYNPDMKAMLTCLKVLKNGEKLVIYVEGTRNKTGTDDLQDIKGGAGVFATRAKCPIIPVMLLRKPRIFRRTKIIVGKPFELAEYYGKKLSSEDIEKIDLIIKEKMIEEHETLKKMVNKNKNADNKK